MMFAAGAVQRPQFRRPPLAPPLQVAGWRDKETAKQRKTPPRVVRGITLARKVLIIRQTSGAGAACSASGGVSARGIAASPRHVLPL